MAAGHSGAARPRDPAEYLAGGRGLKELLARRRWLPVDRIRNVTFQIRKGKTAEFQKVLTNDVLPLMKRQPGFKHELAMVSGDTAVGLSVWQDQISAEKYQSGVYPEVLKALGPVIDGTPQVLNFDLAVTTLAI